MEDTKLINKKLVGLLIALIMLVSISTNAFSITLATTTTDSTAESNNNLKLLLDEQYITQLGLRSVIADIHSSLETENSSSSASVNYNATILSERANYTINEYMFQLNTPNHNMTVSNITVTGPTSFNYYATEKDTALGGNKATSTQTIDEHVSNSTGNYLFKMDIEKNSADGSMTNIEGQIDGNLTNGGTQSLTVTQQSVGKYSVAIQNTDKGKTGNNNITPYTTSWYGLIYTDPIPIADPTPTFYPFSASGHWQLVGGYVWWYPPNPTEDLITNVLGIVIVGTTTAGIGVIVLGLVYDTAELYMAHTDPGQGDDREITLLYWETLNWNFGIFGHLAVYTEMGCYTNHYWNGWQDVYISWTYVPFEVDGLPTTEIIPTLNRSGPWPGYFSFIDPPVTVNAYDESNNVNVEGIPIFINGMYAGNSGDTLNLPDGSYTISFISNAFDHFEVYDTSFSNDATVTFSDANPVALTAFYYYIPVYTVYVNAMECLSQDQVLTNVYLNGQLIGSTPTSFTVPIGVYSIDVDSYGVLYDYQYIGCGIYYNSEGSYGGHVDILVTDNYYVGFTYISG